MGRNAMVLIAVLLLAALLVSSLLGPFAFLGIMIVAILVLLFIQSRKDYFEGTRSSSSVGKDRRFELKRGRSVFLKNYGVKVKFSRLSSPKTSMHSHTPQVLEITVEKDSRSKTISFDANNMRATKIQEAFGTKFHLVDLRNNIAVLSVD